MMTAAGGLLPRQLEASVLSATSLAMDQGAVTRLGDFARFLPEHLAAADAMFAPWNNRQATPLKTRRRAASSRTVSGPPPKSFGETFGAATGVSAPSYRKHPHPASETTNQAAPPPL
jgi:hypothetical protein